MTGSYVSNEFSIDISNELERLTNQVDLFWDKECVHYKDLPLGTGSKILECGSGSGHYLTKLVDLYPKAEFFSLEADPAYAEAQKIRFDKAPYNKINVINSTIENSTLPENNFDLIILRLVLEHLPHPDQVVASLRKLLKVGGQLFLIDNDFHNHLLTYPHIPELSTLYDAYCRQRVDQGGNPYIGRELPMLMEQEGFGAIDFDTITAHSTLTGDTKFISSESSAIGLTLVEDGYIDSDTYERLSKKWSEVLFADNHGYYRNLYICKGTKETAEFEKQVKTVKANKPAAKKQQITGDQDTLSLLASKWKEVLNRDDIDVDHNIFEVGGTSLMILHIRNFIREELGQDYPSSFFFQHPTIRKLAEAIDEPASGKAGSSDEKPASNLQQLKDRFKKK